MKSRRYILIVCLGLLTTGPVACDAEDFEAFSVTPGASSTGASSSSSGIGGAGDVSSSSQGSTGGFGGTGGMGGAGGAAEMGCIADVSVADGFVVALRNDGTMFTWGSDEYGELGDGTPGGTRATPLPIATPKDVIAVAAARDHVVALRQNGSVWSWGNGYHGALGHAGNASLATPTQIANLPEISQISTSSARTTVLAKDGSVYTWGCSSTIENGMPALAFDPTPIKVQGLPNEKIVTIGSGNCFSAALTENGDIYAWGSLSDDWTIATWGNFLSPTPTLVFQGATQLSVAEGHWIALDTNGIIWEGRADSDNVGTALMQVEKESFNLTEVKYVVAGVGREAIIKTDGSLRWWGRNPVYYHISAFTGISITLPTTLPNAENVRQADLSYEMGGFIDAQNRLKVWGVGLTGQIGAGNEGNYVEPVMITEFNEVKQVRAGWQTSFAWRNDGTIYGWGANHKGQIGDGTTEIRVSPVAVSTIADVVDVASGHEFTLVLDANGAVWSFGKNYGGQLGDGTFMTRSEPQQIQGLPPIVAIAAGTDHAIAVAMDGSVWAWGSNNRGQFGDGTQVSASSPQQVPGFMDAIAVSAGNGFSTILAKDGTVWTCGDGSLGTLGIGFTENSLFPVQVTGLDGVIQIDSAAAYTLALRADGTVWGWGWNQEAQLGDGLGIDNYGVPVLIPGLFEITQVSAGMEHALALDKNGRVWGWGTASRGELAMPPVSFYEKSPIRIETLTDIVSVEAGMNSSLFVRANGTVAGSGINYYAQLGIGKAPYSTIPVDPSVPCGNVP